MLALPAEAFAGACQMTKRDHSLYPSSADDAVHTTVHNNTTGTNPDKTKGITFDVTIDRERTEKANKTVAPGDMVGQLSKLGINMADSFVDFTVSVAAQGGGKSVSCAFRIKYGQSTVWDLLKGARSVCGDASVLCPKCKVSCDKSYHPDKQRWNTTFTITN
jgi:hypothetical protein